LVYNIREQVDSKGGGTVKRGDVITVTIAENNMLGNGYCRLDDGMSLFVENAVPGDVCTVRIREIKGNYATAEVTGYIRRSDLYRDGGCGEETVCGGCVHRNIPYDLENSIKHETVRRLFRNSTMAEDDIGFIAVSEDDKRNKITLHTGPGGMLGFYSEKSRDTVPLSDRCMVISEAMRPAVSSAGAFLRDTGIHADIFFIKNDKAKAVRFEDEAWLEQGKLSGYAAYDDAVFFYKFHLQDLDISNVHFHMFHQNQYIQLNISFHII